MIKGVTSKTGEVFEALSNLDIIKDYVLVGGTALSLQLNTRLSEDLDFMKWKKTKNDKPEIPWDKINKELSNLGLGKVKVEVLGFEQALFEVADVKLSFYSRDSYSPKGLQRVPFHNNVAVADINSIGVMKIDAMLRRNSFRDYYDLYSILKNGTDINDLLDKANDYSGHVTKRTNLISIISNGDKFFRDKGFEKLNPIYNISNEEIADFIKKRIESIKLFTEQEIPQSELAKLGLSLSDITPENKELLLMGKQTNAISIDKLKGKSVRLSLSNENNSINLVCCLCRESFEIT
ncbi:MAG: nucleotidyl transferase AbiEii/AbiGii toxin family protein [Tannerella sp.]|jgi:hypothetical protein|nr:nucleotidyl transferase AbiEii/AbiGii toxin family protein [Tannerella sp.]